MISVIIPSYNEQGRIARCLTSLREQTYAGDVEIIVVDSSRDDTPTIIRRDFPEVTLVHRERQTYPAEARNIGMGQACGDILAFIDADCVAASDWLGSIEAAHARSSPAIGGPIELDRPASVLGVALFAIEFSEYGRSSPARDMEWMPSCNMSVKRDSARAVGGFPTDMHASEDMLFSRRLATHAGRPLRFDPAIRIRHTNRNTYKEFRGKLSNLGYWSGRSRASGQLPGGFLVRMPAAAPLLLPYRFAKILPRVVLRAGDWRLRLAVTLGAPLVVLGLGFWTVGFYRGLRDEAG